MHQSNLDVLVSSSGKLEARKSNRDIPQSLLGQNFLLRSKSSARPGNSRLAFNMLSAFLHSQTESWTPCRCAFGRLESVAKTLTLGTVGTDLAGSQPEATYDPFPQSPSICVLHSGFCGVTRTED